MTDSDSLLDLDTFEMAEELFGAKELLAQCREHFDGLRATLNELHKGDDPKTLAERIHRTQGPSSIFGATEAFDVVASLEMQLRDKQIPSVEDVASIDEVIAGTLGEIEGRLAQNV